MTINRIRLDFQPPENLIEETVQEYVEQIRRGDKLTPVYVRFDGSDYFCQDGFHRLEAARRTGLKKIKAEVFPGTLADMEADWQECLKRLHADLRRDSQTIGPRR